MKYKTCKIINYKLIYIVWVKRAILKFYVFHPPHAS